MRSPVLLMTSTAHALAQIPERDPDSVDAAQLPVQVIWPGDFFAWFEEGVIPRVWNRADPGGTPARVGRRQWNGENHTPLYRMTCNSMNLTEIIHQRRVRKLVLLRECRLYWLHLLSAAAKKAWELTVQSTKLVSDEIGHRLGNNRGPDIERT